MTAICASLASSSYDGHGTRGQANGQVDLLVFGLGLYGSDRLLDDGRKALPGFRQFQLAGLDFRCIENLIDDAE